MKQHYNDETLAFLKEKILGIRIALFKAEINSALKLPNNIIQALKVEDDGSIWFLSSCSGEHAESIDKSFYAYLDFYKKGTDYRLQLSGKATIVEDDNQAFLTMSNYSKQVAGRLVLIKMKIMQAEYFENAGEEKLTGINKIKSYLNHWFFPHSHMIYDFK